MVLGIAKALDLGALALRPALALANITPRPIIPTQSVPTSAPSSATRIGVFDSGVGGLSVLKHIRAALPGADLLYVADSGHVPYGDKSPEYIRERSLAISRFLLAQDAAAIVIACNTATAAAAGTLRAAFDVPIIGMEPAVKPAVAATRSGVVGVLATVGTLESARFAALLQQYAGEVEIVTQACPGLVEQVEAGDLRGARTRALVERYTQPLLTRGADVIVLGCTHYPFLRESIADVAGPSVTLIDTGAAVARQVVRMLPGCVAAAANAKRVASFWTSGEVVAAQRSMALLWGEQVMVSALPTSK